MKVKIPRFAIPLYNGGYRYNVLYGGRGSGKSYSVADCLLVKGKSKYCKILCAREFQNSISDSVLSLLEQRANEIGLQDEYEFKRDSIIGKRTGTEFLFKGVRHNIQSIKSIPGITDLWIEEAQTVSKVSWDVLIPTIREEGSQIYVTYNPDNEDDPTHQKFIMQEPPANSYIQKVNWYDNPWFPSVLASEKDHQYEVDPELAAHIWEGECRSHSDAQIFKGKFQVDIFSINPSWEGPYYGADWGFSKDPTVLVQLYIDRENGNLIVSNEASSRPMMEEKKKINSKAIFDLTLIPHLFDKIPGSRHRNIRSDSSRPETINYVAQQGFMIQGAEKWQGSVEDGIEFIKSFRKVIIHANCKETAKEFKNYSYKVDKLTSDVTTDIVDDWNHSIDAIRYALEPMIKREASMFDLFAKEK